MLVKGKYQTTAPSLSVNGAYEYLQIDSAGNLKTVTQAEAPETKQVLAKATGSDGGLGKVSALAASEAVYIRLDCSDRPYSYVDWLISTTAKTDVTFYVGTTIANSLTATLASFTDADTIILNGLTITGESTAAQAAFASRKFSTAGGTDTLDAVELAKLINADYAVTTAGTSVAATDKLTITTDEGAHTIVAAAEADYTTGKYALSATAATEMASIVLAINHTQNVTCATAVAGDEVYINDKVYVGVEGAATVSDGEFSVDTSDNACATSLAAVINDATYGVTGVTAVASGAIVYLYRDAESYSIDLSSSSDTTLACVTTVGGVPGVTAAATGASAELSITPTWTSTLTVTESGDKLTVVDIDIPGVYATSSEAVVTVVPGTPASQTEGELAPVLQMTAAARCTISQAATLLALQVVDSTSGADLAANNTTAGTLFHIPQYGYDYAYVGLVADGTTPTIVVSATPRV